MHAVLAQGHVSERPGLGAGLDDEYHRNVRRDNGKLVRDGSNTATLTLETGKTYTAEAAGDSGRISISIVPL